VNRGSKALSEKLPQRGDQQRLAAAIDLDEGYFSRIVSGKRIPGIDARRKLETHAGIPMQWWDEPVEDAPPASERNPLPGKGKAS